MLKFGSAKQNKTDGVEESLLGQSSKLQAENLKVLAGDVEDSIAEASSAIAGRIDEANLQRAHKAVLLANEALEELKLQGRQSARLDQAACDMLSKAYGRQLEDLSERLKSSELLMQSEAGREGAEHRIKAAAERLQRVRQVQAESEASVQRSLGIVEGAQQLGAETAVAMKGQTEQLKDIYADVRQMETDLQKANRLLNSMARRAVTDRITACLLILIVAGIIAAVAVKILLPPPLHPPPLFPPSPPSPSPLPTTAPPPAPTPTPPPQ